MHWLIWKKTSEKTIYDQFYTQLYELAKRTQPASSPNAPEEAEKRVGSKTAT